MKNLGTLDRMGRIVASLVMVIAAVALPWRAGIRLPVFLGLAGYMLMTSVAGTCLGYKLMGYSTCPNKRLA
ncbi:MAG: DUF2892 domain-containing protein [Proteobacteria bacterium]|nr:DUF2892 domain-containing protein [Pseudomonadota bacterium]